MCQAELIETGMITARLRQAQADNRRAQVDNLLKSGTIETTNLYARYIFSTFQLPLSYHQVIHFRKILFLLLWDE